MTTVTVGVNIAKRLSYNTFVSQIFIHSVAVAAMATGTHIFIKMNAIPFPHCRHMTIRRMAGDA
jgi:hypothetical protein